MQRLLGTWTCRARPSAFRSLSTFRLSDRPHRLIAPDRIIAALRHSPGSSVWKWLDAIYSRRRVALHESLQENKVSFAEYGRWKDVIRARDIHDAVEVLYQQRHGCLRMDTVPAWTVLFAAAYKTKRPEHAAGPLLELIEACYPRFPEELKPGLLILATFHLARFSLVTPLHSIVSKFLSLIPISPSGERETYYNVFLKSLSANRIEWGDNASMVLSVLKSMETHQAKLWESTYNQLLNDRHVTSQLTIYLRDRAIGEGYVPTASHLERYLRLFAKGGAIEDKLRYREELDKFRRQPPETVDPASAFDFLRRLTRHDSKPDSNPIPSGFRPNMSDREWNRAFADLVEKREQIHTHAILAHFSKAQKHRKLPMSMYSYTLLVRALVQRKSYAKARTYWHTMVGLGFRINAPALTVGLQMYAGMDMPHKAFNLLEQHCARVDVALPASYRVGKPTDLDLIAINEFFLALFRARRPDAAFIFWDYMTGLYGQLPNEKTFSLLLECVRVAMRLDDSPSGRLSQFSLFRREAERHQTREGVLAFIRSVLGDKVAKVAEPYKPFSVWKDPYKRAQDLFWSVADGGLVNIGLSTHNCHNYLLVAGMAGDLEELPRVLKAMKRLGVEPTVDVLAVVLVFWHDREREPGTSRWRALVHWMQEWVGDKSLPLPQDLSRWRERILMMKGLVNE